MGIRPAARTAANFSATIKLVSPKGLRAQVANKYISTACLDQHLTRFHPYKRLVCAGSFLGPSFLPCSPSSSAVKPRDAHGMDTDHIYVFINALCALTRKLL